MIKFDDLFILHLLLACAAGYIGKNKKRSFIAWFCISMIFGISTQVIVNFLDKTNILDMGPISTTVGIIIVCGIIIFISFGIILALLVKPNISKTEEEKLNVEKQISKLKNIALKKKIYEKANNILKHLGTSNYSDTNLKITKRSDLINIYIPHNDEKLVFSGEQYCSGGSSGYEEKHLEPDGEGGFVEHIYTVGGSDSSLTTNIECYIAGEWEEFLDILEIVAKKTKQKNDIEKAAQDTNSLKKKFGLD